MITDLGDTSLSALRRQCHAQCVVCSRNNERGLRLEFRSAGDGAVEASFACARVFEGYPAMLHGGVIGALLDGAMTNCLFAHGRAAVTAELSIRFRHPVATDRPATVRAWIEASPSPLYCLAAEVVQAGQVMATAKGKFIDKAALAWRRKEPP